MGNWLEYAGKAPTAMVIDSFCKAAQVLKRHEKIMVSVSGGRDSDVMVDLFTKLDVDGKCVYVWFDTGLEYEATKRHLDDLEQKYHIKVERESY